MAKIGIPRALLYFKYKILWKTFFDVLGQEVIVSPKTNKDIQKEGVRLSVDESCLSLKLFLGHTNYLKDKCDYIFIPRIVSIRRGESTCVKLWALSDIVRNSISDVKIIDYTVDANDHKYEIFSFMKLGFKFSKNPFKILYAYLLGRARMERDHRNKIQKQKKLADNKNPKILIVSHPYTTYDAFLGEPIIKFIEKQGLDVLYSDIVGHKIARKLVKNLSTDLYWTYNKEIIGAIEYYKDKIDGVLFLQTFPCGPDSLVIDLCRNKIKDFPVVVITLDELQAEAGLKTRIESFADILKMKKNGK